MTRSRPSLPVEEWAWLLAAALAPLALNPLGCSPFELPKAVVAQACALAAIVFAWLTPVRPRRMPVLVWLLLAYGSAALLAMLVSIDRDLSLWGSLDRQQGLLTVLAYLALAGVVAARLRTWSQAHRLLRVLVWASAPVVLYALLQALRLDPIPWSTDAVSPVFSTIGRANFLGSYLVLVFPLTAVAARLSVRRWPCWLLLGGQMLALLATQTRAAWVGAAVALPALLILWGAATRRRSVAWAGVTVGSVLLLAVLFLNLLPALPPPFERSPALARLASLSHTSAGSTAARVTIWRAALPLIAARPWFGYGLETTELAFAPIYPPQLVYYQGRNVVVDRLHNLVLDAALTTGLAGLLAFLAVTGIALRSAAGTLRHDSDMRFRLLAAGVLAALLGHLVDLQFSFELTASGAIFFLLVGLAGALGQGLGDMPPVSASSPFALLRGAAMLLVLLAFALFGARPLAADVACGRAIRAADPSAGLAGAITSVRMWPVQAEYRIQLGLALWAAGDVSYAMQTLGDAQQRRPGDPALHALSGTLLLRTGDARQARLAEEQYRSAIELAPNIASYHLGLGAALAAQGRLQEGIAALEHAVALDATYADAYGMLARLYEQAGRAEDARRAGLQEERWRAAE